MYFQSAFDVVGPMPTSRSLQKIGQKAPAFKQGMNGPQALPVLPACGRIPNRTPCTLPTQAYLPVPSSAVRLGKNMNAFWTWCQTMTRACVAIPPPSLGTSIGAGQALAGSDNVGCRDELRISRIYPGRVSRYLHYLYYWLNMLTGKKRRPEAKQRARLCAHRQRGDRHACRTGEAQSQSPAHRRLQSGRILGGEDYSNYQFQRVCRRHLWIAKRS